MSTRRGPLFLGLDAYSAIGGIQRFNQRVMRAGAELAAGSAARPAAFRGLFLHDRPADAAACPPGAEAVAAGGSLWRLARAALARLYRADVLLLGHVNLLPVAALLRLVRPGLRTVLFVHGVEVWDAPGYRRKRAWEPWVLRRCVDEIAAVSRFTADAVVDRFGYPPERITVFPNAVDERVAPLHEAGARRDNVVLAVSRLGRSERDKHVDKLVRAMPALRREVPDARLVVIGEGELKAELKALADEVGAADAVSFLGRVADAELDDAYARAAVFALPSTKEGFGIVYLEAWQRFLPVLAATRGAAPEVVSDGVDGRLVDPQDVHAVAAELAGLLAQPAQRQAMAAAGHAKVQRQYLHRHFRQNLAALLARGGEHIA